MKFSYSAVWDDTVRLLRTHGSLIVALAGVFLFLPALAIEFLLPQPTGTGEQVVPQLINHYSDNFHWLVLGNVVNMIGTISIYLLVFGDGRSTVGGAIVTAFGILPFYFLASILTNIMVGAGMLLLILPGLYLFGRLCILGPLIVAEGRRSPFDAIRRAFEVTKGKGWAVIGLVLLVALAGAVLSFVIAAVLGSVFLLLLDRDGIGGLLLSVLRALLSAGFSLVMLVLFAAIYRRLASGSDARVFE